MSGSMALSSGAGCEAAEVCHDFDCDLVAARALAPAMCPHREQECHPCTAKVRAGDLKTSFVRLKDALNNCEGPSEADPGRLLI